MPSLDWTKFYSLPGDKTRNFENLCRGLIRLQYGRFGDFKALANQPGVEFHIKLTEPCQLGNAFRWFGWQCKLYQRNKNGTLKSASCKDIEHSLKTTERVLPDLTDWVLWTPYTLSKKDQEWYYSLSTQYKLHLWAEEEVDTYLSGDALILRSTYFGEQVLTPSNLAERHRIAIQPIQERWLEPVHQAVDAERIIRRMLGEVDSWGQLIEVGKRLKNISNLLSCELDDAAPRLTPYITSFIDACSAFADTLINFHQILADGDLDVIQQKLKERKILINIDVRSTPRHLRSANHPAALHATNALDDMYTAQELLDEAEEFLGVGLVAVLADAGGGKTQMAAQLTAPQEMRIAGIFLQGRNLHRGQSLDDLAKNLSINGIPMPSIEMLLAAVDAAGKRACCRLPIVIDGLNEAENPKDWKPELASLSEIVKKYPNVLVVCTLRTGERKKEDWHPYRESQTETRESFAVMALPDGIKAIESEGFGGDVDEAIEKYFSHFKIDPGDSEIPTEFLQHPLTLRIFCEVTNPKKESEVKIDYFPTSLAPLFDKYVANVAERISQMINLNHSYTANEVKKAIYTLGIELWKCGKREISESGFRDAVSDASRAWDSSIVNLLAQEGILFKNPGNESFDYVVTPTYDALGGYIVANALLIKYVRDSSFAWLNNPEVVALFTGDTSHELAFDILRSLVTLTPRRMQGKQIWQYVSEPLKKNAIALAAEIDAEYLDQETVIALWSLSNESSSFRSRLFVRFQVARAVALHPLNAAFLDETLRAMSVSERDLVWTEWIRETRSERFNDLVAIEGRWKQQTNFRTDSDQLRAKWVMWLLTSTDRELRNVATRALYWFGRGNPAALFEDALTALAINDPYIPERMLAASYGVAMARHVDLGDQTFVTETLPTYARSIYDSMFAESAPFSTTHSLTREYGSRIIEMASLHHPELFTSEEIQRSKAPFKGGLRDWGESEASKERRYGADSPFRMDFENYTLGRLVPGRSNYDFTNEEYQKVRSQILWRIEQLGWSSEKFRNSESSIEDEKRWSRAGGVVQKIERYGKKYSWIAFYEMTGLLHDLGKIKRSRKRGGNWDLDIDPSFPEQSPEVHLIHADFLGDPDMEMKEWITNGVLPDVNPYLQMAEIQNEAGPWVMLDGYIAQENETLGRNIFCFIRSFLVLSSEADSFFEHLSNQNLGGRWLPEKPSVGYTFSGEIPWCETFPENNDCEFSFMVKEETIKVERMEQRFFLDGKQLDLSHVDIVRLRLLGTNAWEDGKLKLSEEELERIEIREIPVEVEEVEQDIITYHTLIPVCDFSWENSRSAANNASHATTLVKEIASDLKLIGQPQTFDLVTNTGVKATCEVSDRSDDFNNSQSLFYMREELLRDYLEKNDLALVWAVWGERGYSSNLTSGFLDSANRPESAYFVYSFTKRYE
ncbi:NACHT domain-containing NTPase [Picosynechococcus sp. PCC 7117]|uniref:NACHT domain-containing protein n=1 Tax=Picosynechococcus sp. PCC 7117 TaxID=195498 RepID=UPI00081061F8|nr:hypothetical protein [Picosynechococcus sp. PCC 7117]ANV88914.1 hypothetical protein AWQ22_14995 [Picosynechococcus sp. PCC 7117]